jgi:hypothetical protein
LLNPELAHRFDDFAEKNSAYSLSPVTIAGNLDKDFDDAAPQAVAPRRARAVLFGRHHRAQFDRRIDVLSKVRRGECLASDLDGAGGVFQGRAPGAQGPVLQSTPAREEFHINTDDLEAARQGVSSYERHALIPHEAYQALYAAGEAQKIFGGYKVHIISTGNQVISELALFLSPGRGRGAERSEAEPDEGSWTPA